MLLKLILEGLGLGAILVIICYAGIRKGAEMVDGVGGYAVFAAVIAGVMTLIL